VAVPGLDRAECVGVRAPGVKRRWRLITVGCTMSLSLDREAILTGEDSKKRVKTTLSEIKPPRI